MDEDQPGDGAGEAEQARGSAPSGSARSGTGMKQANSISPKTRLSPRKAPFGQHVAVERAEQGRDGHRRHHHQDRVQEIGLEAGRLHADLRGAPGAEPGLDRQVLRQRQHVAAADLVQRLQRGDQHHVERQQVIDGEEDQQRVDRRRARTTPVRIALSWDWQRSCALPSAQLGIEIGHDDRGDRHQHDHRAGRADAHLVAGEGVGYMKVAGSPGRRARARRRSARSPGRRT